MGKFVYNSTSEYLLVLLTLLVCCQICVEHSLHSAFLCEGSDLNTTTCMNNLHEFESNENIYKTHAYSKFDNLLRIIMASPIIYL